jgi:hypothetical protein
MLEDNLVFQIVLHMMLEHPDPTEMRIHVAQLNRQVKKLKHREIRWQNPIPMVNNFIFPLICWLVGT